MGKNSEGKRPMTTTATTISSSTATNIDFRFGRSISCNKGKIVGSRNKIVGSDNAITGHFNVISGHSNTIMGDNCEIIGDNNVIHGENCTIHGNGNLIFAKKTQEKIGEGNVVENPDAVAIPPHVIDLLKKISESDPVTSQSSASASTDDNNSNTTSRRRKKGKKSGSTKKRAKRSRNEDNDDEDGEEEEREYNREPKSDDEEEDKDYLPEKKTKRRKKGSGSSSSGNGSGDNEEEEEVKIPAKAKGMLETAASAKLITTEEEDKRCGICEENANNLLMSCSHPICSSCFISIMKEGPYNKSTKPCPFCRNLIAHVTKSKGQEAFSK